MTSYVVQRSTSRSELGLNCTLALNNSFGSTGRSVGIADGLDDGGELRLEGGTTHEEAIDIGLSNELTTVSSVGRTAILNASSSGNISADIITQP